jgi:hypothetical protein
MSNRISYARLKSEVAGLSFTVRQLKSLNKVRLKKINELKQQLKEKEDRLKIVSEILEERIEFIENIT